MREGKISQAKEGCEKGLGRSQCRPARSVSEHSVVQFLSRMLGDVAQGAVPVCAQYFYTALEECPGWLHPWSCCPAQQCHQRGRQSPGIILLIHLSHRLIQCERAGKGATGEEKVDHEDSITDPISVVLYFNAALLAFDIFQEYRFCSD